MLLYDYIEAIIIVSKPDHSPPQHLVLSSERTKHCGGEQSTGFETIEADYL